MLKSLLKKSLGATAIVAMAGAFMPAHAAGIGCGGKDQASAEGKVEGMADGPAKFAAQRHIAAAQDALLKDRMHDCAMHLSMAMQAASQPQGEYAGAAPYAAGPGPYAGPRPYAGTMAEAPYPGPAPYAGPGPAPHRGTMAEAPYGYGAAPYGAPYQDTTAEGPDETPY